MTNITTSAAITCQAPSYTDFYTGSSAVMSKAPIGSALQTQKTNRTAVRAQKRAALKAAKVNSVPTPKTLTKAELQARVVKQIRKELGLPTPKAPTLPERATKLYQTARDVITKAYNGLPTLTILPGAEAVEVPSGSCESYTGPLTQWEGYGYEHDTEAKMKAVMEVVQAKIEKSDPAVVHIISLEGRHKGCEPDTPIRVMRFNKNQGIEVPSFIEDFSVAGHDTHLINADHCPKTGVDLFSKVQKLHKKLAKLERKVQGIGDKRGQLMDKLNLNTIPPSFPKKVKEKFIRLTQSLKDTKAEGLKTIETHAKTQKALKAFYKKRDLMSDKEIRTTFDIPETTPVHVHRVVGANHIVKGFPLREKCGTNVHFVGTDEDIAAVSDEQVKAFKSAFSVKDIDLSLLGIKL